MENDFLICQGYGFLGKKLEILCLSGRRLFSVDLKTAKPTDVFIAWSHNLKIAMEFIYYSNKFSILDVSIEDFYDYYEPCPLKLYKNTDTGEYRIEI